MIGTLKPVRAVATIGGLFGLWKLNNHKSYLKDDSRTLAKKYCEEHAAVLPGGDLTPEQAEISEVMARFKEQETTANYIESNPIMESLVNPMLEKVESVTVPVAEAVSATLGLPSAIISGYVLPALLLFYGSFVVFLIYRQFKMQSIILNGSSSHNGSPASSQSQPVFHIHNHPTPHNPYNLPHNRSDFLTIVLVAGLTTTFFSGVLASRVFTAFFPPTTVTVSKAEVFQSLDITKANQEHLLELYKNSDMLIQQANNTNKFILFLIAVAFVILARIAYNQHKLIAYKPIQVVSNPAPATPLQLPSNPVEQELAYVRRLIDQDLQNQRKALLIDPVSILIMKTLEFFLVNRAKFNFYTSKHSKVTQRIVDNPNFYPVLEAGFGFTAIFLAIKSAFPYIATATVPFLIKEYYNWYNAAAKIHQSQATIIEQMATAETERARIFTYVKTIFPAIRENIDKIKQGSKAVADDTQERLENIETKLTRIETMLNQFASNMRARADEFFGWNKRKPEDDDKPGSGSAVPAQASSAGRSADSDSEDDDPLLDSRITTLEDGTVVINQRRSYNRPIQGADSAGQSPSSQLEEVELSYEQNTTSILETIDSSVVEQDNVINESALEMVQNLVSQPITVNRVELDFDYEGTPLNPIFRSLALPAISSAFYFVTGFTLSDASQGFKLLAPLRSALTVFNSSSNQMAVNKHAENSRAMFDPLSTRLSSVYDAPVNSAIYTNHWVSVDQDEAANEVRDINFGLKADAIVTHTEESPLVVQDSFTRRLLMGSFTSKAISYGSFMIGGPVLSLATKSALHYVAFGQAPAWMPAITGSVNKLVRSQTDPALKDYSFGNAFKEVKDGFNAPLPGNNMVTFKGGDMSDIDE